MSVGLQHSDGQSDASLGFRNHKLLHAQFDILSHKLKFLELLSSQLFVSLQEKEVP